MRCALALLAASLDVLIGGEARAQVSGSVAVVSDYRFRGVSLSDGRPEPQVHLGYDGKGGWYAGAFASGVALAEGSERSAQLMIYGGRSWRRPQSTVSWEAGAAKSVFTQAARYNYNEIFAGLSSGNISGRLYYSPDYFGSHGGTLYAEANGSYPVGERYRLLAHVGYLRPFSVADEIEGPPPDRIDLRIGASVSFADWGIQIAWIGAETVRRRSRFPDARSSHAWVMDVSYLF